MGIDKAEGNYDLNPWNLIISGGAQSSRFAFNPGIVEQTPIYDIPLLNNFTSAHKERAFCYLKSGTPTIWVPPAPYSSSYCHIYIVYAYSRIPINAKPACLRLPSLPWCLFTCTNKYSAFTLTLWLNVSCFCLSCSSFDVDSSLPSFLSEQVVFSRWKSKCEIK